MALMLQRMETPLLCSLLPPILPSSFMTETAFKIFFVFFNPMPRSTFLIGSKKSVFLFIGQSFTNGKWISSPILSAFIKILATFSGNSFPVAISLYISNIYIIWKNQMKIKILLMYLMPEND